MTDFFSLGEIMSPTPEAGTGAGRASCDAIGREFNRVQPNLQQYECESGNDNVIAVYVQITAGA